MESLRGRGASLGIYVVCGGGGAESASENARTCGEVDGGARKARFETGVTPGSAEELDPEALSLLMTSSVICATSSGGTSKLDGSVRSVSASSVVDRPGLSGKRGDASA